MRTPTKGIFLSYASQDTDAARRVCDAMRAAGSRAQSQQAGICKKTVNHPTFENHARAEWDKLDESVKEPLRHLLKKRLDAPHLPSTALHRDLANCYRIKLLKQGYRLIYQVIYQRLVVLVIPAGKHDKNAVYDAALKRRQDKP